MINDKRTSWTSLVLEINCNYIPSKGIISISIITYDSWYFPYDSTMLLLFIDKMEKTGWKILKKTQSPINTMTLQTKAGVYEVRAIASCNYKQFCQVWQQWQIEKWISTLVFAGTRYLLRQGILAKVGIVKNLD